MDFKKDLLLIDLETTGLDPERHEIIQLAAVLLDKKTLKEKKVFNSYIRPSHWENRDKKSMAVNKIVWEKLKNAPTTPTVLKQFRRAFKPKQVVPSYYVGVMDIVFLQEAFKKAKLPYPFDYHSFNIWSLFYPFLAKKNLLKSKKDFGGFGLESLIKNFNIKMNKNQLHDALTDARVEAAILRKIMQSLKL